MTKFSSKLPALSVLFFVGMLERMSYYGMRAGILLYAIDTLLLDRIEAFQYYGFLTISVTMAFLPMGILADLFKSHKGAVIIGSLVATLGYFLLIPDDQLTNMGALLLVVLGVGLLKPSLTILVGRQFTKQDKKRDLGYIIYYTGINIGALGAGLLVGAIGDQFGWNISFTLCGIITFISVLLFVLLRNVIKDIETDLEGESSSKGLNFGVICIVILLVSIYWALFEFGGDIVMETVRSISFSPIPTSLLHSLQILFYIPFTLVALFIWLVRKTGSSFLKLAYAFIFYSLGMAILVVTYGSGSLIPYVGMAIMHAISEVFLSPIALSYMSRLSPINYSASIMGLYFTFIGLFSKVVFWVDWNEFIPQDTKHYLVIIIPLIFAGIIFLIKKILIDVNQVPD